MAKLSHLLPDKLPENLPARAESSPPENTPDATPETTPAPDMPASLAETLRDATGLSFGQMAELIKERPSANPKTVDRLIRVDLPDAPDASDARATEDGRSPTEVNKGARFKSLMPVVSYNSLTANSLTRDESFAVMDQIGADTVLEVIANGTLPVHLANDLGVPQLHFRAWSSQNITAEQAADATSCCAEALQFKSLAAAMSETDNNAAASMIKHLSVRLAEVAAQLSPDQWNQAPKVEQVDQIQPLSITVQTAAGAAYVADQRGKAGTTDLSVDESTGRVIPLDPATGEISNAKVMMQAQTTVDIRPVAAEGHAVTSQTRAQDLAHMDQFKDQQEKERALPPHMRTIDMSGDMSGETNTAQPGNPDLTAASAVLSQMQAVAEHAAPAEPRSKPSENPAGPEETT